MLPLLKKLKPKVSATLGDGLAHKTIASILETVPQTKITPPVGQHQRGKTIPPPGSAGGGMSIHAYHGGAFHVFVERSIENITFK